MTYDETLVKPPIGKNDDIGAENGYFRNSILDISIPDLGPTLFWGI